MFNLIRRSLLTISLFCIFSGFWVNAEIGNYFLSAVSGNGYIEISWEEVEGATSYVVYRSTKSTSGYKAIVTVTDGLSYTDSSAKKGTTYYYKVAAATETTTGAQSTYAKIKSQ